MCLAVPGKIIDLDGGSGTIDFGDNVRRKVNLSMVEAVVGDYVIVHAGFAIQKLSRDEAIATLEVWKEYLQN